MKSILLNNLNNVDVKNLHNNIDKSLKIIPNNKISSLSTRLLYVNVPELVDLKSEFFYNFYHYKSETNNELLTPYSDNVIIVGDSKDILERNARYIKLTFNIDSTLNSDDNNIKTTFMNSDFINNENEIENNSYYSFKLNDKTINEKLSLSILNALENHNQDFSSFLKTSIFDLPTDYYANNLNFNGNNNLNVQNEIKLENEKEFFIRAQINKKYLKNIALVSKHSNNTFSTDWEIIEKSVQKFNSNDFDKSDTVPLNSWDSSEKPKTKNFSLVGFIIKKYYFNNGNYQFLKSYKLDCNNRTFIDINVLYGKNYRYDVTCVYNLEIKSDIDNKYYHFFIESSSKETFISAVENKSPNPPSDFFVKWDHINNKPLLTWRFPVEKQRDVKSFQIFKRFSDLEPYTIICQQNFNDYSIVMNESVPENLYKNSDNLYYIDNKFDINKECIYALACIDAHGNFSNLTKQIKVKFNKFTKQLETYVISKENAPKFYPNLYLEEPFLLEAIDTNLINELTIYLDADTINVLSNNDKIATVEGDFKINILDLELEDSLNLNVKIDIDDNLKNNKNAATQNYDFSALSNLNFNIKLGW